MKTPIIRLLAFVALLAALLIALPAGFQTAPERQEAGEDS